MEEISKKVILNGYVYALLKPVVYQKAIPRNSGFGRCRPTGGVPSLHALCCCPHTTRLLSQESTAATRTQSLRASWATKGHKTRWKSYLQHLIQSDPANLSNTAQGTQTFHRGIAPQRRASSISGVQEFPISEREHTRPLTHRQGTFLPASARQPADPGQWAPRSQPGPARAPPRCVQRLRAPAAQTPVAEWPPRAGFLGHGAARAGGERGSPRSPRARLSLATRSAPARPDGGPAPRGGSRVRRLRGRDLLLARRALRCAHLFSFLAAAIAATNTLRPSRPLEVTASRGVSLPSPRRRPAAAPVELRSRRRPRPGSAPPAPSSGRQSPPRPADARRRGAAPAVPALAARQAGGGMGSVERARPLPAGRGGAAANGRFQRAPPMAAVEIARGEELPPQLWSRAGAPVPIHTHAPSFCHSSLSSPARTPLWELFAPWSESVCLPARAQAPRATGPFHRCSPPHPPCSPCTAADRQAGLAPVRLGRNTFAHWEPACGWVSRGWGAEAARNAVCGTAEVSGHYEQLYQAVCISHGVSQSHRLKHCSLVWAKLCIPSPGFSG